MHELMVRLRKQATSKLGRAAHVLFPDGGLNEGGQSEVDGAEVAGEHQQWEHADGLAQRDDRRDHGVRGHFTGELLSSSPARKYTPFMQCAQPNTTAPPMQMRAPTLNMAPVMNAR